MTAQPALSPILVLAAPGMPGQTVAAALGRNPGAYDLPELPLERGAVTDGLLREMIGLQSLQMHGLLRGLAQLLTGEQTMASIDTARRWLARRAHLPTVRLAREIAERIAPRRMVRPVTAALFDPAAAERLMEAYPQASVLRLRMHPRDHGAAVMRQAGGAVATLLGAGARIEQPGGTAEPAVSGAPPDPQELWLMAEEGADAFCAAVPAERIIPLRVEDLLAAPAAALGDVAARLGLAHDATALAAMCRPEDSAFAGPGPFGAHLGGDIVALEQLTASGAVLPGPLPWRDDGSGFRTEITARALALGYS